jgi:hypothetical protein
MNSVTDDFMDDRREYDPAEPVGRTCPNCGEALQEGLYCKAGAMVCMRCNTYFWPDLSKPGELPPLLAQRRQRRRR